jgi:molybdopterin synthase sulfur carrier subunit
VPIDLQFDLFGPVRDAVGRKTVERTFDAPVTVREALVSLRESHPPLTDHLGSGEDLGAGLTITVDGDNVSLREGLDTELDDGAVVRIAPPVVGG